MPEPDKTAAAVSSVTLRGPFLVAVQGSLDQAIATGRPLADRIRARFPSIEPVVLVADLRGGEAVLVSPEDALRDGGTRGRQPMLPPASQGAIPGHNSPLGPTIREALAREAIGLAIVAAEPRDDPKGWLEQLLEPVVEAGFDFVCPAYHRQRTDGAINTGIVAPLLRTLYGQALRQPLGTEAALWAPSPAACSTTVTGAGGRRRQGPMPGSSRRRWAASPASHRHGSDPGRVRPATPRPPARP